jgi:hypothetical protein
VVSPGFFNKEGVSTALATTVIIVVLVISLTWMAYTVVLNARQQAQAAERAESIALKAKELIRVYIWMDPAKQPSGRYLNLTKISFVGSWSGETTINGLLVVYRDGSSRMLSLNIKLGAGEEKTYLPSELGIQGVDNFDIFKSNIKYIQAHTSLGNDFVSLWGRPDMPAFTATSQPPTTTTTTVTSTVTQMVTSTIPTTVTSYSPTVCTVTTWVGATTTKTVTVTTSTTSWATVSSTATRTETTTTTQTRTETYTVPTWTTTTTTVTTYTRGTTSTVVTVESSTTTTTTIPTTTVTVFHNTYVYIY